MFVYSFGVGDVYDGFFSYKVSPRSLRIFNSTKKFQENFFIYFALLLLFFALYNESNTLTFLKDKQRLRRHLNSHIFQDGWDDGLKAHTHTQNMISCLSLSTQKLICILKALYSIFVLVKKHTPTIFFKKVNWSKKKNSEMKFRDFSINKFPLSN